MLTDLLHAKDDQETLTCLKKLVESSRTNPAGLIK